MTEEIPKRVPSEPVFCETCHAAVRLERGDDRRLRLVCACGHAVSLDEHGDAAETLPAGWSE